MVKRGEVYEVRCNKCDVPSANGKCPHAYGDLQYCDCCEDCRALCYEPGQDMYDIYPCKVDEELTNILGIKDCICTTGYLCLYCRNKVEARKKL
jgi:hypothetical protein